MSGSDDYTLRDGPDGHALIKLRPCPCCGGEANLWAQGPLMNPADAEWIVRCDTPAKGGCGLSTWPDKSDRVVMERWNKRAKPAQQGE